MLDYKEVDLRSDTITKPNKDMLLAMFNADVGDDVYGEDQTVKGQFENFFFSLFFILAIDTY